MTPAAADAKAITRASKSNLALAFVSLPRERRDDITVFYAWCRVIDDIADDPGASVADRHAALNLWKRALHQAVEGESELAAPVRGLLAKYKIDPGLFLEIIAGVEMDLHEVSYATWDDLRQYCHRVASVVGLVSIEIIGYSDPGCKEYALHLGLALQLTNIIRDVGQDFSNGGRIYLPAEDMARFGYTREDLSAGRRNEAFQALMEFETERALGFYAAEIMRNIYRRLLFKIRAGGFRIFNRRNSLSRWEKAFIIVRTMLLSRFF